jgi:D-amino-acid oxidase
MATPNLPTPDFTYDPNLPGACIAGVRPYRNGSYRLEAETLSNKFIVHNYGHGGAGITLSWGCAAKVRYIVQRHLVGTLDTEVAVLGAGVMGLTAAARMLDLGLTVTIYSDRKPLETTSAKAGGQWAVSVVEYTGKERELTDIIKIAYATFKASIGSGFGVYERPNYTALPSHNLDVVIQLAPGLIPPRVAVPRLPFEGHTRSGFVYQTLLIEPPVFLAKLEADLRPQPALQYLYGRDGYMFPRADHVVIGGTFELGVNNETPDPHVCQGLVDHMASLFGKAPSRPLPDIHIHHPDHAPIVNPAIPMS